MSEIRLDADFAATVLSSTWTTSEQNRRGRVDALKAAWEELDAMDAEYGIEPLYPRPPNPGRRVSR